MMIKSCENCYEWCGEEQGCDSDNAIICRANDEHPHWKPDYLTLEAENAGLKRWGLELMDELIVRKHALGLSVKHNLKDIIKFLKIAQKDIEEDLNEGDFEDD
jgi:hypothetical protein